MNELLRGFERIQVKSKARSDSMAIRINVRKTAIHFTKQLSEAAGMKAGDRYDIYKNGKTFAFVKESAGLLTIKHGGGQCIIANANTCLEIAVEAGEQKAFDAWVDEGIIFFRVDK